MSAAATEKPVIACENLWKVFGRRHADIAAVIADGLDRGEAMERYRCVVAVAGATLEVRRGEIFCVMGLSGSGKSTLVRLVNRLIEPSAGRVLIDGRDIGRMAGPELRRLRNEKIGMVFQNMALLPHRTVRDNVALGLELRGAAPDRRWARGEEMLAAVRLEGWGDRRPHELSGGMQQRVGLARALACEPQLLLMDEPFSALDPLIRRELQEQFAELSAQLRQTTVFITHDLDEAVRLGHRIAVMKDGRVIQTGTPEEIVLAPADAYVRAFVQGISRLKLITAAAVMEPLAGAAGELCGAGRVPPTASLDRLIDTAVACEGPLLVADGDTPVGVVTGRALLKAIQAHR